MNVRDLRFVITGSAKGIGAETARVAAAHGALLMLSDVTDEGHERILGINLGMGQ